ncbi:glycerol kinase GlpK [Bythopirellula goksoeyrii]|uniref:Glycerol kinase n=1 Tax=Bythopirellula goksoeyrii TaxID=1400387 RepID=A0A5B9QCF1_9BACT|nr:glycerol kinase GlpK [Bythopirellula goksoeyrii]QEG35275.1 Glycerol kinase [Bythopirellula goksoeyrii]
MAFLLALDQGTTSSRAIVFTDSGEIKAVEQKEFKQFYPKPGWVEHDPEEIWITQLEVAAKVLKTAGLNPSEIAALGITNQRETTVVWDRASGEPIHPAIVWQDRRTADTCQELRLAGHLPTVREKTGLLLDPYFSGTKIAWILDHVPQARTLAEAGKLACGTIDTWLVSKLTGGQLHITDVSNASRTLLMNIHTGDWDEELLELFQVPRSILPEIRPSSEVYGEVDSSQPLAGIKIAGIAGDQQSALFGQTCFEKGATKNTYGTGCFMLMNTSTEAAVSENNLLTTVAWKIDDKIEYAIEGSVFVGGAVVSWLRDGLGIIKSASEVESLANSVSDSGGVILVPAFAGLGAPHWDPYARGTIIGITGGTTAAHIARAAVDSIVFQVADLLDAMRSDTGVSLKELRVDGGASVNNALLQFQADILQIPVVRPTVTETTALGAAYLAGLASGVWNSRDDIAHHWEVDRRFEPQMAASKAAELRSRWGNAIERTKNWVNGEPTA